MLVYRSVSFKILTFALIFFWKVVCFTLPLFKVHNWLPRATSNVMPLRDLWRQYESVKSTADRDLEKYPDVIRSLAVKPVYASQILSGTKSWEVRRKHTHVRERVAIYASSTKHIWGTVMVQDCVWKQMADVWSSQFPIWFLDVGRAPGLAKFGVFLGSFHLSWR